MQFVAPYSLISSDNPALHLHPEHLADLRASGLTDETIRAAGVYSLRPGAIARFFGQRGVPEEIHSALCFPYQGGGFARIKLFPALGKMKYAQPPGTSARLYGPFPVNHGPVYVCEGEKKTLAAHQAALNAVGIGGVWNWLSGGHPIDDLNLIPWDGREATIIPDSDVFQRIDLLRAVYALGRELAARAARVYVARIPSGNKGKVGLDDYIVGGGSLEKLEVFALGHHMFNQFRYWHGKWKVKRALREAA